MIKHARSGSCQEEDRERLVRGARPPSLYTYMVWEPQQVVLNVGTPILTYSALLYYSIMALLHMQCYTYVYTVDSGQLYECNN